MLISEFNFQNVNVSLSLAALFAYAVQLLVLHIFNKWKSMFVFRNKDNSESAFGERKCDRGELVTR